VERSCSWCEKKIALFRFMRDHQFCCDAHRSLFMDLEVARLCGHQVNLARLDGQRLKDASAGAGAAPQADTAQA
jgi:hypothetical protein